jgi:hypothetical protein
MAQAFHLDVWTDQNEKRSYAAMAETREEALALAREQLPSDWRIEAPETRHHKSKAALQWMSIAVMQFEPTPFHSLDLGLGYAVLRPLRCRVHSQVSPAHRRPGGMGVYPWVPSARS